jgi:hypothetical protein
MRDLIPVLMAAFAISLSASGTPTVVNASSAKLTVYAVWLSPNADCSSPVQIGTTTAGTVVDVAQSGTLVSGQVAPGTYKCLIIEMNTVIKFTPAASDGNKCVGGTEYSFNICTASNSTNTSKNPLDGTTIHCSGTSTLDTNGDKVFVYVSTNSICNGTLSTNPTCVSNASSGKYTNAFLPPSAAGDALNGFALSGNITITGDTTGTFVFNTDSQVDTNGIGDGTATTACDLEGFTLSYK